MTILPSPSRLNRNVLTASSTSDDFKATINTRALAVASNVGPGVTIAEAAARRYYKTSAANLSRDQAARMAAMVPNPRWYENHRSSRAYQRRVAVISRYMGYAQVPR